MTHLRRSIVAAASLLALAMLVIAPRGARATSIDYGNVEVRKMNTSLAYGLGGAVFGYYCQKMDYSWFHRVVPRRFTPLESGFLLGGWVAFLAYTSATAAESRANVRAEAPFVPREPQAWPELGVDGEGRAFAGAGFRF